MRGGWEIKNEWERRGQKREMESLQRSKKRNGEVSETQMSGKSCRERNDHLCLCCLQEKRGQEVRRNKELREEVTA